MPRAQSPSAALARIDQPFSAILMKHFGLDYDLGCKEFGIYTSCERNLCFSAYIFT